jgi:tetratricopeptide (TPR) repeat protein
MLLLLRKLLIAIYRAPGIALLSGTLLGCAGLGAAFIVSYGWAEYHYQAALRALERRELAQAQAHVDACLDSRPESAEANFLGARCARLGLDYREADRRLREYQRLGGVRELFNLERQLTRAQRGDLAQVEGPLMTFVEKGHPDTLWILEALGRGYLQNYRLEKALHCLQLLLERRPDHVQALLWRGEVWERLLQPEDALADYRRALELAPERDEDRLHLVETLISTRHPNEAAAHLAILSERRPDDPRVLLSFARCRRLQGKPDDARRLLANVLERSPEDASALAELGRLELENNRPAQAEPWLRKAFALQPYEKDVVYALSQSLQQTGKSEEAERLQQRLERINGDLDHLDEVLRKINRSSSDPALRHEAGMIFLQNGHKQEGLRWLGSALRLDPLHGPTHEALANYYDGIGERGQASWHWELAHQKPTEPAGKRRP